MLLLALAACRGKEDGYLLRGKIAGKADGMKATLVDAYAYPPVTIDSAVIRNGQFLMKGRVEYPGMYMLVIDPVGEGNEEDLLASKFYLENSAINFSGHIDSLPTYYWRQDRPVREGRGDCGQGDKEFRGMECLFEGDRGYPETVEDNRFCHKEREPEDI